MVIMPDFLTVGKNCSYYIVHVLTKVLIGSKKSFFQGYSYKLGTTLLTLIVALFEIFLKIEFKTPVEK